MFATAAVLMNGAHNNNFVGLPFILGIPLERKRGEWKNSSRNILAWTNESG